MPLAMATSGLVFRDSARDRSGSFAESDLNRLPDNARHETDVPFQETKRGKERSQEELIPNKHKSLRLLWNQKMALKRTVPTITINITVASVIPVVVLVTSTQVMQR